MEVKQKKVKTIRPKLKLFRASEPEKSVLMWGVNYSITQLSHITPKPVLLTDDFKANMKVTVHNQLYIRDHMPVRYTFKEYSPVVFQDLRRRFDITSQMLLESFTTHQPLRRTRKSKNCKSSMMLTHDKRFAALSLSSEQRDGVLSLLEEYHAYIVNVKAYTRLPKWIALYRIKLADKELHILIVPNLFFPPGNVDWKFSFNLHNDSADSEAKDSLKKYSSFLEEDCLSELQHKIRLSDEEKMDLWQILQRDINFLYSHHLYHIHLLLGVNGISTNSSIDSLDAHSASRRLSSATEDEKTSDSDGVSVGGDIEDVAVQETLEAGDSEVGQNPLRAGTTVFSNAQNPPRDESEVTLMDKSKKTFQYYIGLNFSFKKRHAGSSRKKSHLHLYNNSQHSSNDIMTSTPPYPTSSSSPTNADGKRDILQEFFLKYVE